VAGRASIRVTPLAICALKITRKLELMNPNKAELLEFGFRRGIPYNLLNLNPGGTTPLHFVVDPIDAPGATAVASNFTPSVVAPFVCTGTIPMARLPASFHVKYPFPAALVGKLNSRFDDYGGTLPCDPVSAPPDKNIKQFLYPDAAMKWMVPAAKRQVVLSYTKTGALLTYAEIPSAPNPPASGDEYGLLWSFAKPVRFVDGTEFPKTQWSGLFFPNGPASNTNYPVLKTPYSVSYTSGKFFQAPSHTGELERRVLNIPLLNCTGLNSSATTAPVLGVGRFFMQVKASEESTDIATGNVTPAVINGEFAGLADEKALGTGTRLYQ
jgi:hypothetical protein